METAPLRFTCTIALIALSTSADAQVPVFEEDALIYPNDAAPFDNFGRDVAIDGDTAVFGAPFDDTAQVNGGAAYVFVREAGGWTQQAELLMPGAGAETRFGATVAIWGDTIVVGAPLEDAGGVDTGSATIFVRSGTTWTQQQKLTAPNGNADDRFGFSVDIDSERVIVGMPGNLSTPNAFVFLRTGTTWSIEAQLPPSAPGAGGNYGYSVALDGDRALVGAFSDNTAYVFLRSGTTWAEEQQLVSSDSLVGHFGHSVALDGTTALIGAPRTGPTTLQGAAYVFLRSGTTWTEEQKLFAPAGFLFDQLGIDVALNGDVAAVGDLLGPDGDGHGAVRLFVRGEHIWSEAHLLVASNAVAMTFGEPPEFSASVAIDGNSIAVGAPGDDSAGARTGTAFVFTLPLLSFCDDSDGALASCPCPNPGSPDTGCDLAQGTGGVRLAWVDQRNTPLNRATLSGTGFPAMGAPPAVLMRSNALGAAGPVLFGDGITCLATPVVRLAATTAAGGASQHAFGHGSMAGSGLFYYQVWFRNTPASFCDPVAAFNVSSGRTLLW